MEWKKIYPVTLAIASELNLSQVKHRFTDFECFIWLEQDRLRDALSIHVGPVSGPEVLQ